MRLGALFLLLAVMAPAPAATPEGEASALRRRAEEALAAPALRGARVGALVVDGSDGTVLFERKPNRGLIPASNQKLLTAMAALRAFGPAHRFTTSVHADRLPKEDGTVGVLYVRGAGDPALTSEDWWRLAADLRRSGVRRVTDVMLDEASFDAERWHPSWGPISARAYHAPVGALSANYGAFTVEVRPGAVPGGEAWVTLDPPVAYLQLASRARTGPPGRPSRLVVERRAENGTERVLVSGWVASDASARLFYRSVVDPALYAGAVLRWQLDAVGIDVSGGVRKGVLPERAPTLLEFEGRQLAEIVRLFLKYSNNSIAETLVKAMAFRSARTPASWAGGMQVLRAQLAALGLDLSGEQLVDGSGLSRDNRVSPRLLVDALRRARRSFEFGPEFVAALPIASRDGTLAERAPEVAGEVRAKTGLLDGVVGLSGYARSRSGRELAFSLLVNGHRGSDTQAMRAADGFVHALVADSVEGAADQESVRKPRP